MGKYFLIRVGIVVLMFACSFPLHAQPQNIDVEAQPDSMVQLNFPKDVELTVLVEYVSQRLGINFIYDEQLANKRLTIKAPQEIPASTLMGLLESALHIKGFTLVESAEPGFMRIAPTAEMTVVTKLTDDDAAVWTFPLFDGFVSHSTVPGATNLTLQFRAPTEAPLDPPVNPVGKF